MRSSLPRQSVVMSKRKVLVDWRVWERKDIYQYENSSEIIDALIFVSLSLSLASHVRTSSSSSSSSVVATTTTPKTKKNPLTAADLRLPRNKDGWKVHPGYSSGASSYSGSDRGEDDDDDDEAAARHHHQRSSSSRHSGILALSALRDEMAADGDLAKTLVRIEVRRFIYSVTLVQYGNCWLSALRSTIGQLKERERFRFDSCVFLVF